LTIAFNNSDVASMFRRQLCGAITLEAWWYSTFELSPCFGKEKIRRMMQCTERNGTVMRLFVTFWCNVVWQVLDENDTLYISLFASSFYYSHDGGESVMVLFISGYLSEAATSTWLEPACDHKWSIHPWIEDSNEKFKSLKIRATKSDTTDDDPALQRHQPFVPTDEPWIPPPTMTRRQPTTNDDDDGAALPCDRHLCAVADRKIYYSAKTTHEALNC
jgi:hypothetical protein